MNKTLYSKLEKSLESWEIIEIYDDSDPEVYFFGAVAALDSDSYIYVSMGDQGRANGIRFRYTEDIWKITDKSKYIDSYKRITEIFKRENKAQYKEFFRERECSIQLFFEYALKAGRTVALSIRGSEDFVIAGEVLSYDAETLTVRELDGCGEETAVSYINIPDITACSCDSEDSRIMSALAELSGGVNFLHIVPTGYGNFSEAGNL